MGCDTLGPPHHIQMMMMMMMMTRWEGYLEERSTLGPMFSWSLSLSLSLFSLWLLNGSASVDEEKEVDMSPPRPVPTRYQRRGGIGRDREGWRGMVRGERGGEVRRADTEVR